MQIDLRNVPATICLAVFYSSTSVQRNAASLYFDGKSGAPVNIHLLPNLLPLAFRDLTLPQTTLGAILPENQKQRAIFELSRLAWQS